MNSVWDMLCLRYQLGRWVWGSGVWVRGHFCLGCNLCRRHGEIEELSLEQLRKGGCPVKEPEKEQLKSRKENPDSVPHRSLWQWPQLQWEETGHFSGAVLWDDSSSRLGE